LAVARFSPIIRRQSQRTFVGIDDGHRLRRTKVIGTLAIAVFEIVFLTVGYMTARIVLPALTFNKIKVDALSPGEAGFNWFGFKRLSDGVLLCDATLAGWIGLLIWALVLVVVVALV
jgi:hypothetical protein